MRALAPDGVDPALDVAEGGVLPELIALTGGPQHVVTVADGIAAAHRVGEHGHVRGRLVRVVGR